MCKLWKKEESNHHFPELNKKKKIVSIVKSCFGWNKLSLVLVALTITIGLTYLFQTNATVADGYKIKGLEDKINSLKEENKKLNLKSIELQSMANISSQVADLNLVTTKDIEIITPVGSAVALR
ncbi:MAG: hypothetical protein WC518_00930 [Patescibacteria group bacterium]